jgi:type IV pilus assembly protein PilQ
MLKNYLCFLIGFLLLPVFINAQTTTQTNTDRFVEIQKKLDELAAANTPGLNDPIDFSVSGVSIQEFLRGIAEAHELNINVDPQLTFKVYNNFSKESVSNVIVFLVREYDLDIRFSGSIMSFFKYIPPVEGKPAYVPKNVSVKYASYSNLLSLDLQGDSLYLVVRKITQVTKKNVILSSGLSNKLISIYIEDMPFDAALNKMAFANELKVVKTDDNFYVLKALKEGDDMLAEENPNAGVFRPTYNTGAAATGTSSSMPATAQAGAGSVIRCQVEDSAKSKRIHLEAINAPIAEVIKTVATKANINYFMYSELKGNCTSYVSGVTFQELLTFLLQSTEYTYKLDADLYLIGERKLEGLRAHKVVQLIYRSIDNIQDVIPAELKKGVEIKEFKELNSILLSGSLPQIHEIEAFIKEVDKVVPMVMIEVIIMEVSKSRTVKTGISAGLSDSASAATTSGTFLPGLDVTLSSSTINDFIGGLGVGNIANLGAVTPNFYMTLSALETNQNVEVKSMPKLSTLNGHDANMSIGQTVYYMIETQNTLGSLTTNTIKTVQYQSVQANQTLSIKPLVSGDDQVTMTIEVNQTSFLPNSNATGPPNSSTSQFKSIIRVRNEEMIVLGGLEKVSKSLDAQGTPILSRIPIIKLLFSSKTKAKSKSILVLFIKPTIIY